MIALALVPPLASATVAAGAGRTARSLPGRWTAVLLPIVALACALSTGVVLCALGCLALVQWHPVAAIGHLSVGALVRRAPVPDPVATACGVLAIALLVASVVQAARALYRFVMSARLCAHLADLHPGPLVVLDIPQAQAYALAGRPGRTVVSRAMLRTLSGPERRALLAHEDAHVARHHFVHLQLAQLAATANPLLARVVPATRLAVERWADAEAVAAVGDPQLVAQALARASLACSERPAQAGMALAAAESDVAARIGALLGEAPRRLATVSAVLALLAAAACAAASGTVVGLDLHSLVEWAQSIAPRGR